MAEGRSRDLTFVLAAGVVVIGLAVASAVTAPPTAAGLASSFSAAPDGTKAAMLVMQRLGYAVVRSFEPVTAIGADPRRTVLILAQPAERASDQDRRAIRQFVEAGGVVLATGCGGASFLTPSAPEHDDVGSLAVVHARETTPWTAGAPEIAMAVQCASPNLPAGYRPVYGDGLGVVRIAAIGDGSVQWWAGSAPLTNEAIGKSGNLGLVLNAVGGGDRRVLWNEFYHGQRRSLLSYAASTELPWIAGQCLIIAIALAMTFTRRRAPVRSRWTAGRHAPMEFVETIATLYGEAGAGRAAVMTSGARMRRLMREVSGLPAAASDERLSVALAPRLSTQASEIEALLRASAAAGIGPVLPGARALPIVQRLQRMSQALPEAMGRSRAREEAMDPVA